MWPFSKKNESGNVLPKKQLEPPLPKGIKPPLPSNTFDFKSKDIFNIVADGLALRGIKAVRGTMELQRDKWGDGDMHLRGTWETRGPNRLVITIDGLPFRKVAWNALTDTQREEYARDHDVRLIYREIDNDTE